MTTFDFSPLFRSTVGFDRLAQMLDSAMAAPDANGYPPYNIESTGDNAYRVTLAVAGFGDQEIAVTQHENLLIVKGERRPEAEPAKVLYRGIAGRSFERRFQIADYVTVKSAQLENGLLHIDLAREVPEALRPRKIAIEAKAGKPTLDSRAA